MLSRMALATSLVVLSFAPQPQPQIKVQVRITVPGDNAQVLERPLLEGTVSNSSAKVWVIVHSLEVSDYYVQPSVTVKGDSSWKVVIYVGRPGKVDVNKQFEIIAVANPKVDLKEGLKLGGWPEAQAKSEVIDVTRK